MRHAAARNFKKLNKKSRDYLKIFHSYLTKVCDIKFPAESILTANVQNFTDSDVLFKIL